MEQKRSVNLCSKYMLPLLGLNRYSFGSSDRYFVNSYIAEDDAHIVVECTTTFSTIITHNANYRFSFEKDGHYFGVFSVPVFYKGDVKRFREGKYSKFTDSAKTAIRSKSGLQWRVPVVGGYKSAKELLALEKDEALRENMERELAVKIDKDAELISIPNDDNFFDLKLSNKLESTV